AARSHSGIKYAAAEIPQRRQPGGKRSSRSFRNSSEGATAAAQLRKLDSSLFARRARRGALSAAVPRALTHQGVPRAAAALAASQTAAGERWAWIRSGGF